MVDNYDPNNPLNPNIADPPGGRPIPQGSPDDTGKLDPLSRAIAAAATGGVSNFMLPGGGQMPGAGGGGGGGNQPDPTKNLDMIIRDELARQYPGSQITPQMVEYIKQQLSNQGLNAAKTSAPNYRSAVDKWVQTNPQASQYFSQSNPFATQQGSLSPAAAKAMMDLVDKYQAPYIANLKQDADLGAKYFAQLLPSLPAGLKGLVQSQIQGPSGLANLPNQVANLLKTANPAEIASAYAQYQNSPATATTQNLFSQLAQKPPGT